MAFTLDIALVLGPAQTGLSLKAALVAGADGSLTAKDVSAGFAEFGVGNYGWRYAAFPDAFRGYVQFYTGTVGAGTTLAGMTLKGSPVPIGAADEAGAKAGAIGGATLVGGLPPADTTAATTAQAQTAALYGATVKRTVAVAASPAPTTTTFALGGTSTTDNYTGSWLLPTNGSNGAGVNAGSLPVLVTGFNTSNQVVTVSPPLSSAPVAGDAFTQLIGSPATASAYATIAANLDTKVSSVVSAVGAVLSAVGTLGTTVSNGIAGVAAAVWAYGSRVITGLPATPPAGYGVAPSSGALPVVVTVTDSTSAQPVQGAIVRASINASSYVGTSNASGGAGFSLDAGTYTVSASAAGYNGSSQSVVIASVGQAVPIHLTPVTPATPPAPGESLGTLTVASIGAVVTFQQRTDAAGNPCSPPPFTVTATGSATIEASFIQGARYLYYVGSGVRQRFITPTTPTFDIEVVTLP